MRIRSAGAIALHFLLLLTSLLDAAGHELLCRDEPAAPQIVGVMPASETLVSCGESQENDCQCCGLCGPRTPLETLWVANPSLEAADAQPGGRDTCFLKPLTASHLSRGPPLS